MFFRTRRFYIPCRAALIARCRCRRGIRLDCATRYHVKLARSHAIITRHNCNATRARTNVVRFPSTRRRADLRCAHNVDTVRREGRLPVWVVQLNRDCAGSGFLLELGMQSNSCSMGLLFLNY